MCEGVKTVEDRQKREERIKRTMTAIAAVSFIVLFSFCITLAMRLQELEKQVQELKNEGHKSLEIVWNEENTVIPKEKIENEAEQADAKAEKTGEETKETETKQEEKANMRKVYLTFDDGPSAYTEEILNILEKYDVKATFFVTGTSASRYPEYLQKILDGGHTLGIHSYSHAYQDIYGSLEAFQADFYKIRDFIYEHTGEDIKLYRFPGGTSNTILQKDVRRQIFEWLWQEEIRYFDWNVSSGDAASIEISAEEIVQNCMEGIQKLEEDAVVLLHDSSGKQSTVEALPFIIEGINGLEDTILLPIDENTTEVQQRWLFKQ